jgi:para-nitrobenzyl esterase
MIIETKYGKLEGKRQGAAVVFKGVPYAKPPVGDLRWCPPQEPERWCGIKIANTFGNRCIQTLPEASDLNPDGTKPIKEYEPTTEFYPDMSEDCLYLNIWTPAGATDKKCPVAFYIHGGGFLFGHGAEIAMDGGELCNHGVILVTINYRLNVFGFFACTGLSVEQGTSGNYGLLDQIAALRWVRENIEAFGGDSGNITVFGHSAGAMSTQALISSPLTKGMIRRASMHSGGGYPGGMYRPLELAKRQGERLMKEAGADSVAQLRAMPADLIFGLGMKVMMALMKDYLEQNPCDICLIYTPVMDGVVLPGSYKEVVERGLTHDVECILGSCKNDVGVTLEMLAAGNRGSDVYNGCIGYAQMYEKLYRKPCYLYYFKRDMPGDNAGAYHCADGWYLFHTLKRNLRPFTNADYELSKRMVSHWVSFMKTGTPNGEGLEKWRPYTQADPFVMDFDI